MSPLSLMTRVSFSTATGDRFIPLTGVHNCASIHRLTIGDSEALRCQCLQQRGDRAIRRGCPYQFQFEIESRSDCGKSLKKNEASQQPETTIIKAQAFQLVDANGI